MADAERDVPWQRPPAPGGPQATPGAPGPAAAGARRPEGMDADEHAGTDGRRKRNWIPFVAVAVALAAIAYFGWRWWEGRYWASTDDAQVGGDVVPVLARVSGYVRQVLINENDQVRQGQLLVVLDDSELKQRLAQARAQLAIAEQAAGTGPAVGQFEAQAAAARANARAAQHAIAQAAANATRAHHDVQRLGPLAAEGIVSGQQMDATRADADAADAQLAMARQNAQAAAAQAQAAQVGVGTASEQVRAVRAAVAEAQLLLSYTRITAPGNGVVARKNVQVGQLVNPGQALMTVVPLANIWVTANLKETQLKGVWPGNPAEVTVDAYHGLTFHGHVESISPATGAQFSLLPPENATGNFTKVVQRVPVRVRLNARENPSAPLRPGMSAEVKIRKLP